MSPERVAQIPAPGTVSRDGVAIMGLGQYAFLFGGSNGYYAQYLREDVDALALAWGELTAKRHRACAQLSVLSLFVPNKATCLPWLYPLWLPEGGTPLWRRVKSVLAEDSGALFCESLLPEAEVAWSHWDSHWNARGCLRVFNETCSTLGVDGIPQLALAEDPDSAFGDLSQRWGPCPLGGPVGAKFVWEGCEPELVSDLGARTGKGHVTGRETIWRCDGAAIPARVCIVGNSFSGAGFAQNHLTWWMARHFREVVFIHSAQVPTDLLTHHRPDVVIHQTVERFMPSVPVDKDPLAVIGARYLAALAAEERG